MPEPDLGHEPSFSDLVRKYERAIDTDDNVRRFDATIDVVDALMHCCKVRGLAERGVPAAIRDHWYTRLAAALTSVILTPDMTLTLSQMEQISRRKQTIVYIFSASGYRNTAHLINCIAEEKQRGQLRVPLSRLAVILAFCGIDDVPPELVQLLQRQDPKVLLVLLLGWLNQRAILTPLGEQNRTAMLAMGPLVEAVPATEQQIPLIVNAWMYSSYASTGSKHAIKASLNTLLRGLMAGAKPPAAPRSSLPHGKKPRLLVIHERFTTDHAMFRCYAPAIAGLSRFFDVVAMVEEGHIDEHSSQLFRLIEKVPKGRKHLPKIMETINSLAPDVIYYPSLGMSHWTVMLAQTRLAPIQMMTLGHPATSMSDAIDYVYTGHMSGDLSHIFSEKVIVGPTAADFAPHSELPNDLPPLLSASEREVKVAVNSKVMKLSYRLIDICKRLTDHADLPVKFTFFPGERNLYFDGLEPAIKSQLPNAEVVPYLSYDHFIRRICSCDIALSAFPFGNTNSTVDTALLGIPTVAHYGPESPAQSDALVMNTVGLPDWLICQTDELYYETALRLINCPSARVSALGGVSREDVRERLFGGEVAKSSSTFAETLNFIYQHHEALMASDQRVFHYSELVPTE